MLKHLQYMFHNGSERRAKRQILFELRNIKSSIFAHCTLAFLTVRCEKTTCKNFFLKYQIIAYLYPP